MADKTVLDLVDEFDLQLSYVQSLMHILEDINEAYAEGGTLKVGDPEHHVMRTQVVITTVQTYLTQIKATVHSIGETQCA